MSREVQKQRMVCTWLSSDSLFCQNTPCCSCTQVRGICMWSSSSKYPVWMQEGLASSQRARYFTTLLSTSDSWFLPDSSAKHWTELTTHYRKPATSLSSFFFFFFFNLFMAVLGLRFCARASSSCGKRGPLFIAVRRPLTVAASLVAEHRLQTRRLSNCGSRA